MAKAKTRGKRTLPEMRCFVACDAVTHDQPSGGGKPSLHGLFDAVYVDKFPGLFRPFFMFARLVGGAKNGVVTLAVTGVDGKPLGEEVTIPVARTSTTARFSDIIMQVGVIPLTAYGTLRFDLKFDGREIGWPCEISVEPPKRKK